MTCLIALTLAELSFDRQSLALYKTPENIKPNQTMCQVKLREEITSIVKLKYTETYEWEDCYR